MKEYQARDHDVTSKEGQGAVLMLQGTASDVGKSIVTTALCRIFVQDGYRTAPYKSQNMALNSYVTLDGKEIGRAQGVQAEACGIAATTDMNPILIKPMKDMHSQIVIHGVPEMQMSAMDYRTQFLPKAKQIVLDALERLREDYDIVVMEGAGSPAEINLKDRDIVNMNLAGWADSPVILVADIDRGGVFAAIVGTLELLEPHEAARIKGFIINKFRGDVALLQPGLDWLEERTGIPVLGVLPYIQDIRIEAEDSVVLDELHYRRQEQRELDIAIIRYPRISNFTDFDALRGEPDVVVRFVSSVDELGTPDVIILPGTKSTLDDLDFIRERGLADAIRTMTEQQDIQLVGICGGYQMLGERLSDPHAAEGSVREAEGLGMLPLRTTFLKHKRTVRVAGKLSPDHPLRLDSFYGAGDFPITAYEIHMGVSEWSDVTGGAGVSPLFTMESLPSDSQAQLEGLGRSDGRVWGSYMHGLFDNDALRRSWLNGLRLKKGLSPITATFESEQRKLAEFDRVADVVRRHVDLDKIYEIIG
ncbi:cobyric acid synthase [Paenibacillus sp. JCM 10914]|uniref:cobyric acid synthase n=1 Tax=Paenibacillus sp. JCM 10914 TaxID=1236974 RepID=UPI0003CC2E94|nr:cobyric acid synthase [Paenibacillus sp. JCM 10914]GAE04473.1 cobyric acid synthase [Paenibacillus sp. JCM 10914]